MQPFSMGIFFDGKQNCNSIVRSSLGKQENMVLVAQLKKDDVLSHSVSFLGHDSVVYTGNLLPSNIRYKKKE